MADQGRLAGKVAIITGGAQGIGRAYCLRFAQEGAAVAVIDLREDQAKDVAREIKRLEKLMLEHARNLEFEKAAQVRDQLAQLKARVFGASGHDSAA